ncbi:MAG: disulfide bond formation protein B [Candidatus Nanohalobium sp.]
MPPCELCWYQRILIFPSLVILGVAVFLDKQDVADYVLPLMVVGIPVSAYHYIIQFSSVSAGCSTAVSCSTTQIVEFGYISIPMMSLTFFLTTAGLMWFEYR